ncbi:MAG: large-conductance mechanosensitive channel protein MscL [Candidatus Amulumruptor caecigallinarius]|nr:large-conductance mechanosensitive channel protein MscL [Candidatus Amulumruptor caecigallinarius]
MGKFIEDFKAFALKGNVIDMAVGVIVGGAFGKIVTSLVNDILMPVITIITGNSGYANMKYVIKEATPATADGVAAAEEVAINYGLFIQNIVDFFIIALCIFIALRYTVRFMKKEKVEEEVPASEPTAEEKLLTQIRDTLNDIKNSK